MNINFITVTWLSSNSLIGERENGAGHLPTYGDGHYGNGHGSNYERAHEGCGTGDDDGNGNSPTDDYFTKDFF